jgi:SAM-dependent methyltransferase
VELGMSVDTDRHWRRWGETDPYFGVMTFPEFSATRISGNKEHFFETGRRDIARMLHDVQRLYGGFSRSRALDFGCGVGRLVLPLSKYIDHTVGVDISPAMIAEARENCIIAGIHNVQFAVSDDALSAVEGPFDLVHSYNVLQHIPVDRGLTLTANILSRLRPGGVAALHYSIQRTLPLRKAFGYAIRNSIPFGGVLWNIMRLRRWDLPDMQMNNYPLTEIIRTFESNQLGEFFVIPERHADALTVRVYGRKAT